ncbi:hypothetical protein HDU67_006756 [Dinochytrium kinnereticum]|nr:hypothetical protein HDU67_006756 [Dinochytrium kinnereticum]
MFLTRNRFDSKALERAIGIFTTDASFPSHVRTAPFRTSVQPRPHPVRISHRYVSIQPKAERMPDSKEPVHFIYGTSQAEVSGMRINYTQDMLLESNAKEDPYIQFAAWFDDAKGTEKEPNAMCISTCSKEGRPSARIVLLKGYDSRGFTFYTNYRSRKSVELLENPFAALTFYWGERSIRIEGRCEKVPAEESDAYFASRPRGSQIGAWASERQSAVLANGRDELEEAQKEAEERFGVGKDGEVKPIPRPEFWGGFRVVPDRIEFWQCRLTKEFFYLAILMGMMRDDRSSSDPPSNTSIPSSDFSVSDTELDMESSKVGDGVMDGRKERQSFLRQTALLLLTTIPEILIHHMLTPFYPYVVRALLPEVEKPGYFVGMMSPVLVIGLSGYCLGTMVLGISNLYVSSLLGLFITGCFAGNTVVAKSMIGELAKDEKARAVGYSAYGVVFGAAGILGTFLGGFFVNSSIFEGNAFLKARPSFLACLVGALFAILAIIVTLHTLQEVRGDQARPGGVGKYDKLDDHDEDEVLLNVTFSNHIELVATGGEKQVMTDNVEGGSTVFPAEPAISFAVKPSLSDDDMFRPKDLPPSPALGSSWLNQTYYSIRVILHPYISIISVYTIPPIALYCFFSLGNSLFHTSLSLLVEAPTSRGGYHLPSKDMAVAAMASSVAKLAIKAVTPMRLGFTPLPTPMPLPHSINGTDLSSLSSPIDTLTAPVYPLVIASTFLGLGEGLCYLAIIMFLTDSVPSTSLGALHGLAACMSSVMKTIGPILGGMIWELAPTWTPFAVGVGVVLGGFWTSGLVVGSRGRGFASAGVVTGERGGSRFESVPSVDQMVTPGSGEEEDRGGVVRNPFIEQESAGGGRPARRGSRPVY